jgi:hypothetical protein
MISRVEAGREILDSLGWESPTNLSSCISVPKNPNSSFFKLPEYAPQGSYAQANEIEYPEDSNETRQEILTTVGHLSNFISAESASRTLKRLELLRDQRTYQVIELRLLTLNTFCPPRWYIKFSNCLERTSIACL